jgi:hypothetical protein
MDRHPGMKVPLATKRAALRDILATIAGERRVVTYRSHGGRDGRLSAALRASMAMPISPSTTRRSSASGPASSAPRRDPRVRIANLHTIEAVAHMQKLIGRGAARARPSTS